MTLATLDQIERSWLLMCEGAGDLNFFKALFEKHAFGNDYHIRFPHRDGKYNGGRANFGSDLGAISVNQSFIDNVKAVLLISDNDAVPATSFAEVQAELRKAGFPVPAAEKTVARADGFPDVVIFMLPPGTPGNLESYCLEAAHSKWGLKANLDTFVAAAPANAWALNKQAKMRVQTLLAATNSSQPDCGFSSHWKQAEQFRIPLEHASFNPLVAFLRDEFPRLLAA